MEHRKIPIGIKIISIALILPFLVTLISFYMVSLSMLPDSKKIELMQSAKWKHLNITTIEQFDSYVKQPIAFGNVFANLFVFGVIPLILAIGLCNFKSWSRIGTIIYSCFAVAVAIFYVLAGKFMQMSFFLGRFFWIFIYAIIIYYLNRPNIKEQFK